MDFGKWLLTVCAILAQAVALPAEQITFMRGENQIWDYPTYDGSVPVIQRPAADNWVSPVNYAGGALYMRYEVISKPSNLTVGVQLCFWMPGWTPETCSRELWYSTNGIYYHKMDSPGGWWQNGTYPWSANTFYAARLFQKEDAQGHMLAVSSCGSWCYTGSAGPITNHIPIRYNAEVIAVSAGATLAPPAGWTGNPWVSVNDQTLPLISGVTAPGATQVRVTFNEALDAATALTRTNYAVNNGVTVNSASLSGTVVTLNTSTLTAGTVYTLTVNSVKDAAGNAIATNTQKTFSYTPFSGWIEDFDDGTANNWTTGEGSWSVSSSAYQNTATGRTSSWYTGQSFADFTYTTDVTPVSGNDVWVIFRAQNSTNYYLFTLSGTANKGALYKLVDGSYTKIADGSGVVTFTANTTYAMKVEAAGSSLKIYANNTQIVSTTDAAFASGYVGFGSNAAQGRFDNAAVPSPTGMPDKRTASTGRVDYLTAMPDPVSDKMLASFTAYAAGTQVRLEVLDSRGRRVATLFDGKVEAGDQTVLWSGRNAAGRAVEPGMYILRLETAGRALTQKIVKR